VKNKLVAAEDWFQLFSENQLKFYSILTQFLFR
jgi:hypothetical protein